MRLYPQQQFAEKRAAVHAAIFRSAERELLAERLKGDFVFLDVGASVGGYALAVAATGGPRARILAVEPLPEVFERLALQHPPERICQRQGGVVARCATSTARSTLFVNTHNQGESSMRIVSAEAQVEQIRVRAKRC